MQQTKLKQSLLTPLTSISILCTAGMLGSIHNFSRVVLKPLSSWDTFRTFYPLMALHSPVEYAQIVDSYIDAWLKRGWMPECRANNLPGWTQGGKALLHPYCVFP